MQTTVSSRASRQSAFNWVLGGIYQRCADKAMFLLVLANVPSIDAEERRMHVSGTLNSMSVLTEAHP